MKIDFSKAFDSVSWEFLAKVMKARGFPIKWIEWVQNIISSSSSRVVINGEQSPYFMHKRGLRQGVPVSPLHFVLAVDVLQQMFQEVNTILPTAISPKLHNPIMAFQYTDDTALITSAHRDTLLTVSLILGIFANRDTYYYNHNYNNIIIISNHNFNNIIII
jgi:Reverse transcriptase (RNA-dependent DNA polymerase)